MALTLPSLLGLLSEAFALLAAGGVAPEVGASVDAGDVQDSDALQGRAIGQVKGDAITLLTERTRSNTAW